MNFQTQPHTSATLEFRLATANNRVGNALVDEREASAMDRSRISSNKSTQFFSPGKTHLSVNSTPMTCGIGLNGVCLTRMRLDLKMDS